MLSAEWWAPIKRLRAGGSVMHAVTCRQQGAQSGSAVQMQGCPHPLPRRRSRINVRSVVLRVAKHMVVLKACRLTARFWPLLQRGNTAISSMYPSQARSAHSCLVGGLGASAQSPAELVGWYPGLPPRLQRCC